MRQNACLEVVVVVLTLTHRHNTMQSVHGRRTGSNNSGEEGMECQLQLRIYPTWYLVLQ